MSFCNVPCVLKHFDLRDATSRRQFLRNVRLMRSINHKNVASVNSCFEHDAKGWVEMPLYSGGPLVLYLQRSENHAPFIGDAAAVMVEEEEDAGVAGVAGRVSGETKAGQEVVAMKKEAPRIVDRKSFKGMTIHIRALRLYQHQTFHFCCHLIQHHLEITTVTSIVKNFRWVTVLKRSKEKKHKESQRTTTPRKVQKGGAVNDSNLFEKSKATHPRATTTSNIRHLNFLVFFVIIFFFSSNSVPKFKQTKK